MLHFMMLSPTRFGLLLLLSASLGCGKKLESAPGAAAVASGENIVVSQDSTGLLFTWIDEKGDAHVTSSVADVPVAWSALVRVMRESENAPRDPLVVVDLSRKNAASGYDTRSMSRREWEAILEKRRADYLLRKEQEAPEAPNPSPKAPPASGDRNGPPGPDGGHRGSSPNGETPAPNPQDAHATIYGASWCGPCHQAQRYLQSKGVDVELLDIEKDERAARDMQSKLARAGRSGGSIPVIDVGGEIIVGFSPESLDRALSRRATKPVPSGGTVL